MNIYLAIFLEALWDASIIPYGHQNRFYAAAAFDPNAAISIVPVAVCGSVAAYVINWWLGKWMVEVSLGKQSSPTQENYAKLLKLAQQFGWILLFLVWVPLGNYLTFLAGFFKVKLQMVLVVTVPVIVAYYFYQAGI